MGSPTTVLIILWDFEDPEDLFHELLWIEELCPDFTFRNTLRRATQNKTHEVLSECYAEWKKKRREYVEEVKREYFKWRCLEGQKGMKKKLTQK